MEESSSLTTADRAAATHGGLEALVVYLGQHPEAARLTAGELAARFGVAAPVVE